MLIDEENARGTTDLDYESRHNSEKRMVGSISLLQLVALSAACYGSAEVR